MRKDIWKLQSKAQDLLPNEPVSQCMREYDQRLHYKNVNITYLSEEKLAYYGHLKICASVWHCPVCASIIVKYRQNELKDALRYWKQKGGRVLLAIFTVLSKKGEVLETLLHPLEIAMKHIKQGRTAQKMKEEFEIAGTISIRELKYTEQGWRPSICQLIFLYERDYQLFNNGKVSFQEYLEHIEYSDQESTNSAFGPILQNRWQHVTNLKGSIDNEFHLSVEENFNQIYGYIAQLGDELPGEPSDYMTNGMAYTTSASELTPFILLDSATHGDHECKDLFQEYARCYKGKRFVAWSKDLRTIVGSSTGLSTHFKGKADYEVVYEEINMLSNIIMTLTWEQWRLVLTRGVREELADVAKSGNWAAIARFLATLNDDANA
jgi:hypothetical protein